MLKPYKEFEEPKIKTNRLIPSCWRRTTQKVSKNSCSIQKEIIHLFGGLISAADESTSGALSSICGRMYVGVSQKNLCWAAKEHVAPRSTVPQWCRLYRKTQQTSSYSPRATSNGDWVHRWQQRQKWKRKRRTKPEREEIIYLRKRKAARSGGKTDAAKWGRLCIAGLHVNFFSPQGRQGAASPRSWWILWPTSTKQASPSAAMCLKWQFNMFLLIQDCFWGD